MKSIYLGPLGTLSSPNSPFCRDQPKHIVRAQNSSFKHQSLYFVTLPGGGHGNPLQYSCLENPMNRGAWRAIVLGVPKSQTQLKGLNTHTYFVTLLCRKGLAVSGNEFYPRPKL